VQKQYLAIGALLTLIVAANAQQVNSSTDQSVSSRQAVSSDNSNANVQSDTSTRAATQTSVTAPNRKDEPNATKSQSGHKTEDANDASLSSVGLISGTTINATLAKPVDSKKAKPGDEVVATTSQDVKANGKVVIRKGSKLIGHVTQAQARGEGNANSSLAILFDHAVLKDGQQVAVKSVVQALARPATSANSTMGGDVDPLARSTAAGNGAVRSGGGGLLRGVSSTAGVATGAVANSGVATAGATNSTLGSIGNSGRELQGTLNSSSTGVIGFRDLSLAATAANSTQGSVISSTGRSVHLDSGTQMLLRIVN